MANTPGYLEGPYLAGDPIPTPEAVERASESAWALWHDVASGRQPIDPQVRPALPARPPAAAAPADPRYAPRQPGGLARARAAVAAAPRDDAQRPAPTLDDLMVLARRNGRVCPQPRAWVTLCAGLRALAPLAPSLPLPPLAPDLWRETSALQKRLALRQQLEWAERQRLLPAMGRLLAALAEEDWLHME